MSRIQAAEHIISHDQARCGKQQFVAELATGMLVDTQFVLGACESRIASNGARYLSVVLRDRSGVVRGVEFDRVSFGDVPPLGSVVAVAGRVEGAQKNKRIKISSMLPCSNYEASDFVASSLRPIEEMSSEFGKRVMSLKNVAYSHVVKRVYHHNKTYRCFVEAPLSESGTLAYRGAALERTLKLCTLIDSLCGLYPQARRQLLLTSALLAYVGAVDAFEVGAVITRSARGKSLPDAVLAVQHIEHACSDPALKGAALAVESVILGAGESAQIILEREIFSQARALLEAADAAQEQDFAHRIVGL